MIARMWRWLFPKSLETLIHEADRYGRITFQQTELELGTGWSCSVRAHPSIKPRYAWTGMAMTMDEALANVLRDARENPILVIKGEEYRPKLGGAEFDEE